VWCIDKNKYYFGKIIQFNPPPHAFYISIFTYYLTSLGTITHYNELKFAFLFPIVVHTDEEHLGYSSDLLYTYYYDMKVLIFWTGH
jgi:hypothetical protein